MDDACADAVVERRGDRRIAVTREGIAYVAHMVGQAEDRVQHHDASLGLALGIGAPSGERMVVVGGQRDLPAHRAGPPGPVGSSGP